MIAVPSGTGLGLLAYRQWLAWPDALVARAPGLRGIASDGHYLLSLPILALLAPVLTLLVGFVAGVTGAGYDIVYTESVTFLAVAVVIGSLSTQLAALGVAAFAVGDVLRAVRAGAPGQADSMTDVVDGWLPMLITYLLLFSLVVVLPRSIRAVVASAGTGRPIPAAVAWPLTGGLIVILTWLTVTAWVAAAPTLVRPVFTWPGGSPTVEAMTTLPGTGQRIVGSAVVSAIARHVWVGATVLPGRWRRRVRAAEELLASSPAPAWRAGGGGPVRALVVDLLAAALATLALAGVLEAAWVWVACFATFLAVRILRRDSVPWEWLQWWKRMAARAPAWVRLLALFLFARLTVDASSTTLITSYSQLALLVLLGVVLAFAIFPGRAARPRAPSAGSGAVTLAAGAVAFWVTDQLGGAVPIAVADNCSVFTDCFGQTNTAAEAGLGLGLLAILSLVLDFIPYVGTAKGVIEAITGRDLLTGDELAPWERVLGIVPFGRFGRLGDLIGDVGRHVDDVAPAVTRHVDHVGGAGRHVDDAPAHPAAPPPPPALPGPPSKPPGPPNPPGRGGPVTGGPPGREPNGLGDNGAVPSTQRGADVVARVKDRLADLTPAERRRVDEMAHDPDTGKLDTGTQLEATDALGLERAGALPGPVRRVDPDVPAERGGDFVDGTGQVWDHKQTWSGRGWDAEKFLNVLQLTDLRSAENIILNHERLNQHDFNELMRLINGRGITDRFIFYPPL